MLISPSLNVSVSFKFESVLFTTVSTTKTSNCTARICSACSAQRIEILGDRRSGV
jgi:hypothetical protein